MDAPATRASQMDETSAVRPKRFCVCDGARRKAAAYAVDTRAVVVSNALCVEFDMLVAEGGLRHQPPQDSASRARRSPARCGASIYIKGRLGAAVVSADFQRRPGTYEGEAMPPRREVGTLLESYDVELDAVAEKIRARAGTKLVALQFPDGLRDYATEIERILRATTPGVEYVISGDPSYGACDLALSLQRLGADMLVHFGHTEMPSINHLFDWDVLYVAA